MGGDVVFGFSMVMATTDYFPLFHDDGPYRNLAFFVGGFGFLKGLFHVIHMISKTKPPHRGKAFKAAWFPT